MSIRDLKEEIYLVLEIKEGHGFGFATSPLVVTASLAGNVHESFVVEPSPHPKFENEFVWVMDKTKMKNIWAEKVPVRIECHSVCQERRSRIGYIILNVKDAQITQDESKITEKHLRLLGLSKEVSSLKPELILSFYLTDTPIISPQLIPQFSPRLESKRIQMSSEPLKVTLGSGRDHFNLQISIVKTMNINSLMPPHSEVEMPQLLYCYSLFGHNVFSDNSTSHGIKLSVVSSLACLKTYFLRNPTVSVSLSMEALSLGQTTIHLENLMLSDETHTRKGRLNQRSMTCQCPIKPTDSLTGVPDVQTYVEFLVSLGIENIMTKKKSSAHTIRSVGAGGDADNQLALPLKSPVTPPLTTQSLASLHATEEKNVYGEEEEEQRTRGGGETYRTQRPVTPLTVYVTITSLCIEQLNPQLRMKMCHPCGQVLNSEQEVPEPWHPLHYQLLFTVPQPLLHSTLSAQPPSLQLNCGSDMVAMATLQPPHNLSCDTSLQYELKGKEGLKVGEVIVNWTMNQPTDLTSQSEPTLTDPLVNPPTQSQSRSVGVEVLSPRAQELKVLSFVEELEDWAEKQRTIVMEGLKEEEAARLASLQAQWEAEVGGQVSEGRQLLQALHSMRDQLRQEEDQLRENKYKLKIYKEELERVHRNKLQEFKDLSRRMQDEFNHKLSLIASDKAALENELEQLRKEKLEMTQKLKEMEKKVDDDKKEINSLTHKLDVLKEKLSMEEESKKFFKEHCRKAEQEIHRINCLRQQELEARLLSDKKSLEHLAFHQIYVERSDLRNDQQILNEIRQQLCVAPALNSSSSGDTVYSERVTDERHIQRAT